MHSVKVLCYKLLVISIMITDFGIMKRKDTKMGDRGCVSQDIWKNPYIVLMTHWNLSYSHGTVLIGNSAITVYLKSKRNQARLETLVPITTTVKVVPTEAKGEKWGQLGSPLNFFSFPDTIRRLKAREQNRPAMTKVHSYIRGNRPQNKSY